MFESMFEFLSGNLISQLLFFFLLNIILFALLNFLILKNNFLIDLKSSSSHKKLISPELVPVSGGVIIFLNLFFFNYFNLLNLILIASIFLIGLFADIQKITSATKRLILQSFVIFIFVFINELYLRSIRIDLFDFYLNYNFISLIFTSFCLLILINGSNFIDGSNFQCSGYYLVILSVLIILDYNFVSIENINLIFSLYPVLLCFIFYNFLNKSYLGDGGSYVLSFIVGYILINLQINANVSPYFVVLFLWYPAFENFFSIVRRILSKNSKADMPDLLHLHHLLFNFFSNNLKFKHKLKLSMPGLIINSFNLVIFYIGTYFIYSTEILLILILFSITIYLISYFFLLKNTTKAC